MKPYYTDDHLTVYHGDARAVMAEMEPESVHCVVTSPPYWGLRDYGTATWEGGDEGCDHAIARWEEPMQTQGAQSGHASAADRLSRSDCKCGARRIDAQLGLEPTPEEYVANMVDVFREVRRVLREDGTLWLNLGDSYSGAGYSNHKNTGGTQREDGGKQVHLLASRTGLKPKDLVGIPWRVAFALQADGWYLRSDIIWAKPNPMPESVTDRPTKSHEMIFLLAKSPRYFFDADAVREGVTESGVIQGSRARVTGRGLGKENGKQPGRQEQRSNSGGFPVTAGRNIRSVWTIATQPYPGAHFATFPRKLVESCVKAGCPPDGIVLDPFAGSGTTGLVAQQLGRRAVLIDLSLDYLGQLMDRNAQTPLGLGA